MDIDLRDYFAGQVMAGLAVKLMDQTGRPTHSLKGQAKLAYRIADALLEARTERRNQPSPATTAPEGRPDD